MEQIAREDFERLIDGARLLESDRRGPKVYETPDGRIVKLFRIKRHLSSNLWSPFAARFARNAGRLRAFGLTPLEVSRFGMAPHLARQVVVYGKVPGTPLRNFLRESPPEEAAACIRRAAAFIAGVQERGVFFRSFHFGNILVAPDGGFALIDILDVWFKPSPLGLWRRRRNLRHLTRYAEDRAALVRHWEEFRQGYLEGAEASSCLIDSDRLTAMLEKGRREFPESVD